MPNTARPEQNVTDDLEPFVRVYDWDRAFAQNADQAVYEVPEAERTRFHHPELAR